MIIDGMEVTTSAVILWEGPISMGGLTVACKPWLENIKWSRVNVKDGYEGAEPVVERDGIYVASEKYA